MFAFPRCKVRHAYKNMGKIQADQKAPIVIITTVLLLVLFLFAFLAKTLVKVFRKALLTAYDDLILAGATVSFCSTTICAKIEPAHLSATDFRYHPIESAMRACDARLWPAVG